MTAHLLWLLADWWGLIWPNLAASALCTGGVYLKLHLEQAARHEELKRHVSAAARRPATPRGDR